jgi:prepilin peptidase CpaA
VTADLYGGVALTGILACAWDLRTGRIPNALTLGSAALAAVVHVSQGGVQGATFVLVGCAVGLALFLPWFLMGAMGGGDVKLMAAFGAWLGPVQVIWACLYAMAAGGVLAAAVLIARRQRAPRAIRYALPMAVGVALSLWLD